MLIPISTSGNYNIEATIYGPGQGITSGMTLFQGVTNTRLIASRNNTVKISMLYTGKYSVMKKLNNISAKPGSNLLQ